MIRIYSKDNAQENTYTESSGINYIVEYKCLNEVEANELKELPETKKIYFAFQDEDHMHRSLQSYETEGLITDKNGNPKTIYQAVFHNDGKLYEYYLKNIIKIDWKNKDYVFRTN